MKVSFDADIKIAGIGMVPWTRLGPERWLPEYTIASLYGWDMPAGTPPRVEALADYYNPLPVLAKLNTPVLLRNKLFQELLRTRLDGYALMTYKPVEVPAELADRKFLFADTAYTDKYENKATFREVFADKIKIPPFRIYDRSQLTPGQAAYERLLDGRQRMVIQDERLSGGRGSHMVGNYSQYCQALASLDAMSQHHRVVISDVIEGARERSIQCCVTKHGVFIGPLQRQIVAHPLIANLGVVNGDKFCGAQISKDDQATAMHLQATEIAKLIGETLRADGYRGIFGIDFLADADDELYVLEINPRITGVTPLLTNLFVDGDIPFYLLHMLELGGYDYAVEGRPLAFDRTGSLLVLHTLESADMYLVDVPPSGTYRLRQNELERVSGGIDLLHLKPDEFILQDYMPRGMRVKAGGRPAILQFGQPVLRADTDELTDAAVKAVQAVRQQIVLRPVT